MVTYIVKRRKKRVGVMNAITDGFVIINAEDVWPHLQSVKFIGYSPVTAIAHGKALSLRIDPVLGSRSELELRLTRIMEKHGHCLERLE